ncbi:major facilitator superfamily domain-containing protein [Stachybotrys elegans]|uniref:Major facilitator superfamily domain-containing protein n=1 Tax=Stachybotrys elegans TaxID=80388 RepID=A0A8K0WNQ8_9HYPO|nr:major facilitator superfamily domain-containing protein [Stachybotrys elegans]
MDTAAMSNQKPVGETPSSVTDATNHSDLDSPSTIYIDPEKEKKILRKFDYLVLPQFVVILVLAYLDRSNIGNARIFGFEEDLSLQGNEFANISSLFYVTYVVFEMPWVLALKRWGANTVLAVAIISWSAVVIGTGFIHNYTQALVMRLLLGLTEAGVFPALSFIISTIYPRESQSKRIAVLYGATAIAGAFGGLIAYGIQLMGDRHGLEAWRWLFIVEGVISVGIGLLCWASLPKNAQDAWFLKEDEKQLMRDRRTRDVAYTGSGKFAWSFVRMALTDTMVWVASISLFCAGIPLFGFGLFLPTIIRGLGFEDLQVNYLTIPVYIMACVILAIATSVSDRLKKRAAIVILPPIVVITGYAIAIGTPVAGAGYFAMFLCSGVYSFNAILVAWVANNVKPDHKRSAALPLFISIANTSGIAASQVYPTFTAPRYIMGNAISLAMEFSAVCGIGVIWYILRRRNQIKAKQRAEGVTDNGEIGDKSLDFEYIL